MNTDLGLAGLQKVKAFTASQFERKTSKAFGVRSPFWIVVRTEPEDKEASVICHHVNDYIDNLEKIMFTVAVMTDSDSSSGQLETFSYLTGSEIGAA